MRRSPTRLGTIFVASTLAASATFVSAAPFPTYPLGTTAGTWQTDRYAPSAFTDVGTIAGRDEVLGLGIADSDSLANRPPAFQYTFYNTQGRGFATAYGAYAVSYGSVYIPSAWQTSAGPASNRRTDLWTVLSPATGGDTCTASNCNLFPIISFSNADGADPLNAGANGRFRVFDGNSASVDGWNDLAAAVNYDNWNDVCTVFNGVDVKVYVNGVLGYTMTDLTQGDNSFGPPTLYSRVMVEAYNFGGANWTANWSGVGAGQLSTSSVDAGSNQSAAIGAAFGQPLAVTVLDSDGSPLPCAPVTFTAPASGPGASLSTTTVLTGRDGVARATAMANGQAGNYEIGVSVNGVAETPFELNNVASVRSALPPAPVPANAPWALATLGALLVLFTALVRRRRGAH
jgi:hypothetical protein